MQCGNSGSAEVRQRDTHRHVFDLRSLANTVHASSVDKDQDMVLMNQLSWFVHNQIVFPQNALPLLRSQFEAMNLVRS